MPIWKTRGLAEGGAAPPRAAEHLGAGQGHVVAVVRHDARRLDGEGAVAHHGVADGPLDVVVGAEADGDVLPLRRGVDEAALVAAERPLLVVGGDDVLPQPGSEPLEQVAGVAGDRDVAQHGVLLLDQVVGGHGADRGEDPRAERRAGEVMEADYSPLRHPAPPRALGYRRVMDLVPKPDQLVSAAGTLGRRLLRGGVADLRRFPRTTLRQDDLASVHHYRPGSAHTDGDPVLLVASLAAPDLAYDLRRGCSLVEHLVGTGRPTYLVEYGRVSFRDRDLGLAPWITDVVPAAVREVSEHAGGRPVHLVGWSLGGTLALLAAAHDADLPIASVSVLGSPVDTALVPLVAPSRPLLDPTQGGGLLRQGYRALGGTPPLASWAVQLAPFQRLVTRPLALAVRVDDGEFWAQVEAVERFGRRMDAYPGRAYGQLFHRFVGGTGIATGTYEADGLALALADVGVPVLVVAGATDQIAPVAAVKAAEPLLTGSPETRFEIVPGGHLGMLTGRAARTTTWPALDDWFDHVSAEVAAGDPGVIGTSPRRRYGSGGSRALAT